VVAEPFLVRAGLMARTPRGRVATPAAWQYLGLPMPPQPAWARQPRGGPEWAGQDGAVGEGEATLFD
jgi:Holliday junction DNA helicase RuvB